MKDLAIEVLASQEQTAERPILLRALGPGTAIAIVVGNVIGTGIFYKPGIIAQEAGNFQLILIAWILGGVVCLLGALSFAELAVMLPQAGGIYVYLREAFGKPPAFLFGWSEFLFNRPASTGALAVAFTTMLGAACGWQWTTMQCLPIALAVIAAMAWVNILGVVWGGGVQSATTIIKTGAVALTGLCPFVLFALGLANIDFSNYATTVTPTSPSFQARFGMVLLAVMWAYNGWHGITPVAEEIRQPSRNIPLALFVGVGILITVYLLATFAYHAVLPMSDLAQAGEGASKVAAEQLLGTWGAFLISAVIMCSTLGTINSNLLISPRIPFAMGRDGIFFRQLGWVHANYRTPAAAIAIQAVMAAVLVIASAVLLEMGVIQRSTTIFEILTNFVVFGASIFYLLAVIAVFVLRRSHPEWSRPYRTWGYPVVPALFIVFYLWFLLQIFLGKPFEAIAGLVLILLGAPVYWFGFRNAQPESSESSDS